MKSLLKAVVVTVFMLVGCFISGCSAPHPPELVARPASFEVRSGTVYLVRGLLGIFSTGMDDIREDLARHNIRAVAIQHTGGADAASYIAQHHDIASGPLVIVGHSLGADEAVEIAKRLDRAGVPVDLLITLDPVLGPDIPPNVHTAINFRCSNGVFDVVPLFRGLPLKANSRQTSLTNIDLREHPEYDEPGTNHFTIDKNNKLHRAIVSEILGVCVPAPADAIMTSAHIPPAKTQ